MIFVSLICLLMLAGLAYQYIGRRSDVLKFPPPGRMVAAGNKQFHLLEQGAGVSTVVFEAGIAASSLSWVLVQPQIAEFAHTYSYDRQGLGWSTAAISPRSLKQSIAELAGVLKIAGAKAPYVLVGHSYGGLLVRAFAAAYPKQTAGLVLVDPVSITEWVLPAEASARRLRRAVLLARGGVWLAHLGVVRFALARLLSGNSRLPRRMAMLSGDGASVAARLAREVTKLPRACWPIVQAHWSDPKSFTGMAAHLEQLPASAAALSGLGPLPDVPVCVISAATATDAELRERAALVESVSQGEHVIASRASHWVQLDRPELVIDACRRVSQLSIANHPVS